MRDHKPFVIDQFNGLWRRDPKDSCPPDHFTRTRNIAFGERSVKVRPGADTFIAKSNVVRMYTYKTQEVEGLLILDTNGSIFHSLTDGSGTTYGPILTIPGMQDFTFEPYNGRAYISPFITETDLLGREFQIGMPGEFVYVYKGDGTLARKAAGFPPSLSGVVGSGTESFKAFNSRFDGVISKGVHLLTVIDDLGNNLVTIFPIVYAPGNRQIQLTNIPLSTLGTTRKILMTQAIDPKNYVPDQTTYTYYEALEILDNTTTTALLSIADSALTVSMATGLAPVTAALQVAVSDELGYMDLGFHIFGVVYETDTGYLTSIGPENLATLNVVDITKKAVLTNIPVSPDSFVTKRHIVATRAIANYNGHQRGYQFYFVPEGTIENNVDTTISVQFFDADLVDDASHLIDNFSEIPAGVNLGVYKSRLTLSATYDDESLLRLSWPGEPEAFDQVDGNVIIPLDGNPITNGQEYRDVYYCTKLTLTYAVVDNGDVPSTWPAPQPIDQGIGASVHGICKVLDSNGVNIEFFIVAGLNGVYLFNGVYQDPELSWKIESYWKELDRNQFSNMQMMNDSIGKFLYITIEPDEILFADYGRGMDAKNIRWANWDFDFNTKSIAIVQTDVLVIGN